MRKALILAVVLATPAQAATVAVVGHQVRYTAQAGEKNVVTASFGTDDITLHDKGADVTAGSGCTQVDEQTARCPAAAVALALGDGDDVANVDCLDDHGLCGGVTLRGGPGNDSLRGSERADVIEGGPGADRLDGYGGLDVIRGGAGNDSIAVSPSLGGDQLPSVFCGPGSDHVFAEALLSLDCESFTTAFFVDDGTMRVRGDRVTIAIRHARCPFAFRWGDHGPIRRATFHPRAWSRATLRLPRTGGPSPHLNYRSSCDGTGRFALLFRLRNPFWQRQAATQ